MRPLQHPLFVLLTLLSLCCWHNSALSEPQNLDHVKKSLEEYYDSMAYMQEQTHVMEKAAAYLLAEVKKNAQKQSPEKLAVVLDIDETALSNYQSMHSRDFANNTVAIHHGLLRTDTPAILATRAFYRAALAHNVTVFFVTGRQEMYREATILSLKNAGYPTWGDLYFRNGHQGTVTEYKTAARRDITAKGYHVVETIGDQYSDIRGGFADKGYKLPNPFYEIL